MSEALPDRKQFDDCSTAIANFLNALPPVEADDPSTYVLDGVRVALTSAALGLGLYARGVRPVPTSHNRD